MALSDAGRKAAHFWQEIPQHFPHIALDEWVVMPDHIHGILVIHEDGHGGTISGKERPHGTARTIGSAVRGFKIGVTKALGESPWHRNYHERIIWHRHALATVRAYIRNNPSQQNPLRFGEPRFFAGNRTLLDLPLTAYLASRSKGGHDVSQQHPTESGGDGGGRDKGVGEGICEGVCKGAWTATVLPSSGSPCHG